jgi:hypothetical protein
MITAWQGEPLRFRDDFVRRLRQCQPGDTIELTTLRPDGAGTRTTPLQPGSLEIGWPP